MLILSRPLSEMLSLKLVLTAFLAGGSRSDIGPISLVGTGQLVASSSDVLVFSFQGVGSEMSGV
jgi:hypothetical protein